MVYVVFSNIVVCVDQVGLFRLNINHPEYSVANKCILLVHTSIKEKFLTLYGQDSATLIVLVRRLVVLRSKVWLFY